MVRKNVSVLVDFFKENTLSLLLKTIIMLDNLQVSVDENIFVIWLRMGQQDDSSVLICTSWTDAVVQLIQTSYYRVGFRLINGHNELSSPTN